MQLVKWETFISFFELLAFFDFVSFFFLYSRYHLCIFFALFSFHFFWFSSAVKKFSLPPPANKFVFCVRVMLMFHCSFDYVRRYCIFFSVSSCRSVVCMCLFCVLFVTIFFLLFGWFVVARLPFGSEVKVIHCMVLCIHQSNCTDIIIMCT